MKRLKYIVLAILLLFSGIGYSQNKTSDSLWNTYNNKALPDTIRLRAIDDVVWSYIEIDPDTSIVLADQELKLAEFLYKGKYNEWTANAFKNIAIANTNKGNYPKALEYYLKALTIFENIGKKIGIGASYNNIGAIYQLQANYPKALEYFLKGLKISEEIGDTAGMGESNNNIGLVYYYQSNFPRALEYYFKALKLCEEIDYKACIADCYGNIGNIYGDQLNQAQALFYYYKDLKIRREIGDNHGIGICYVNIAGLYNDLSNFKLAILYADSSLQISKEIKFLDLERIAYEHLATAYGKTGKYKEAFENHVKFKTLTDSIFNEENSKQLGDMKTKFEVEKKEAELKIKAEALQLITAEEKKRQQFVMYSIVILFVLVLVFALFMFNRFTVTKKQKNIIEKQKEIVEEQKTVVEQQKNLVEEKHKEITDSINYAERIQRALLAGEKLLDENLVNYFILFKPKDVVSGDFYWATKLSNDNFVLVTADSTGHGVPGAIMSILNIACLKEAVTKGITSPDLLLNETRKLIIENLMNDGSEEGGKDGMDASLLSFEFPSPLEKDGQVRLTCASANNPVWIIRNKDLIEIKADRMPVGKHENDNKAFTLQMQNLEKGDIVYALTDGFADQFGGANGKKFKYKQLQETLLSISNEPMEIQKQKLNFIFDNWKGNLEQVDDVCMVGIKI